jgi:glyoxylase-like metal-dependent hydrolase (beta-lactamase superfamily II)
MEVLHNIFQVFGGAYSNIANVFAVENNGAIVLVDTAENGEEHAAILKNMRYWGLDPCSVTHVLISHKHFNHFGNAHIWRGQGAKIVAGTADAEAIESGAVHDIIDYPPYPPRRCTPCPVDIKVNDSDVIEAAGLRFTAIHAPGHTDGSTMYFLETAEKKVLFTGDVLSAGPDCKTAVLSWAGSAVYNRKVYWEETILKKFMALDCDAILAGHHQLCLSNASYLLRDACRAALLEWRAPAINFE